MKHSTYHQRAIARSFQWGVGLLVGSLTALLLSACLAGPQRSTDIPLTNSPIVEPFPTYHPTPRVACVEDERVFVEGGRCVHIDELTPRAKEEVL